MTQDNQSATPLTLPVGPPAPAGPATFPPRTLLLGKTTALVPLQPAHAESLYRHLGGEQNAWRWTYMLSGGYTDFSEFQKAITALSEARDVVYYAVLTGPDTSSESGEEAEAAGMVAFISIFPGMRRLEIGSVILGGALSRSRQATEGFWLMLRLAFDELGYTRVEWKANALNGPSRKAAERLGFGFEGVFRKHMIVKGRFRDTAWFGMTDDDWPAVKRGFEAWLDESNFDRDGKQRRGLKECREEVTAGGKFAKC